MLNTAAEMLHFGVETEELANLIGFHMMLLIIKRCVDDLGVMDSMDL